MNIKLIFGPMYSGKSSEIIKIIRRYKTIGKKLLIISHSSDTRYTEDAICTHDQVQEKCLSVSKLEQVLENPEYLDAEVVIIEEAQFFEDLYETVLHAAEKDGKSVIVAGLDGDYKREPFGDIIRLVPCADEIIKLTALCKECGDGTPAPFTKRKVEFDGNVFVGGKESYEAVCRKHYLV